MSGFSSLLNQFKQTTQQATSLSNTSRGGPSTSTTSTASNDTNKKRNRSIFETTTNNQGTKKINNNTTSSQQQYKYPTKPIKTIYIACPAYTETGGPEALHQLCHMINVGEYTYEVDDDDEKEEKLAKCDEFGRALFTKDDRKPSTVASNNNDTTKTTEKQPKKVIKAYMLYLRERNNNTVEHVTSSQLTSASSNAKSIKYNKYNAPPISSSIDNMPLFLQQREREVDVNYTIDGVHGNKKAGKEDETEESEEYTSELIIWPECWTHLIDSLQPPPSSLTTTTTSANTNSSLHQQQKQEKKKYQIAIWWLSVNNNNGRFLPNQFQLRCDVLHLVQSKYAKNYVEGMLRNSGGGKKDVDDDSTLNVMNMSEFISYSSPSFAPTIINNNNNNDDKEVVRDVDVVYNTAKGQHYTDEIIKRAVGKAKPNALDGSVVGGGLTFHPIGKGTGGRERMTEKEVVALLKRSKVVRVFSFVCISCIEVCSSCVVPNNHSPPLLSISILVHIQAWTDCHEKQH